MIVGKNGIKLISMVDDCDSLILDHYDCDEFHLSVFEGAKEMAFINLDMESAIKIRDYLIERTKTV